MVKEAEPPRVPSAEGTLATRPLTHLLVYIRTRRLTGRLALRAPDGRGGAIDLWRAQIVSVRTAPPVAYFGAVALQLGLVDAETVQSTLSEAAQKRRLHGEVLVERGRLTAAQRDVVLAEQACTKLEHLFALPPVSLFAFYEEKPNADEPPLTLDPIVPVWRAIREAPPSHERHEALAVLSSRALRLVNEAPVAHAAFSADERRLCEALVERPMTLAQMRAAFSSIPSERIDQLVYLLLITKCTELAPESTADEAPAFRSKAMTQEALEAALKTSRRPTTTTVQPTSTSPPRNSVVAPFPSMTAPVRTASGSMRRPSGLMTAPTSAPGSSPPGRSAPGSSPPVRSAPGSSPPVRSAPGSSPPVRSAPGSSPPGAPGSSPPVPSAPAAPPRPVADMKPPVGPAELGVAGITLRAEAVEGEDCFQTLGLPPDAPVEAARAAYFRLVKAWHPDRLPSELASVRNEVGKIFAQITQAHHTLTDADARRAYLAARAERAAVIQSRPRKDVLRLIDTALSKRDFAFAADECRRLEASSPNDAEVLAILAWLGTQAGEGAESTLRAALPALERALNHGQDCARAHFYRGLINKRLGNTDAAYRDFARVVRIDPKNVDATREVRIYEMRAKKKP